MITITAVSVVIAERGQVITRRLPQELGPEAIEHGYRVLFTTAAGPITTLTKAGTESRLDEKLALHTVPQLLIVDELGYLAKGALGPRFPRLNIIGRLSKPLREANLLAAVPATPVPAATAEGLHSNRSSSKLRPLCVLYRRFHLRRTWLLLLLPRADYGQVSLSLSWPSAIGRCLAMPHRWESCRAVRLMEGRGPVRCWFPQAQGGPSVRLTSRVRVLAPVRPTCGRVVAAPLKQTHAEAELCDFGRSPGAPHYELRVGMPGVVAKWVIVPEGIVRRAPDDFAARRTLRNLLATIILVQLASAHPICRANCSRSPGSPPRPLLHSLRRVGGPLTGLLLVGSLGFAADNGPQLTLKWPATRDAEEYVIEREDAGVFRELARVPPTRTEYVDRTVRLGVEYCYQVRSKIGQRVSSPSPRKCGTPKP